MGLQKGPLTYLQDSCAGSASLAPREHTPSGEDRGVLMMSTVSMERAEAVNPARWHWSKRGASNCEMIVLMGCIVSVGEAGALCEITETFRESWVTETLSYEGFT